MRRADRIDLEFKRPAGTSRGYLRTRPIVILREGDRLGEAAPLRGLSLESIEAVESEARNWVAGTDAPASSSLTFAREMLERDNGLRILWPSPFVEGHSSLRINGLVWMGDRSYIEEQIRSLLNRGFRCIKMKVGAADWAEELSVLQALHDADPSLELRVDANGAFAFHDAADKLNQLAEVGVRSIEQPIAVGQWEETAQLCATSPIAIALDEELISVRNTEERAQLLATIQPQLIVLKPSLIGGFAAAEAWIALAEKRGVGWWATSALESNLGLNALAQWLAARNPSDVQGLGTGSLFVRNFDGPLTLRGEHLTYDPEKPWDLSLLPA